MTEASGGSETLPAGSRALRVAWLYFSRGLTQQQVAEVLGISRASVIRHLEELKRSGAVQIVTAAGSEQDIGLALRLEEAFGLSEAIVIPTEGDPYKAVGRALGKFLSQVLRPDMTIGVGWGRTLDAALETFTPPASPNLRVVSLLGGLVEPNVRNPVEFAWRFAQAAGADCDLMLSPLMVDSAETKRRLIADCGLDRLFARAGQLDLAVLGCGSALGSEASSMTLRLQAETRAYLRQQGAVAEILCQFVDAEGKPCPTADDNRLMAADLPFVAKAKNVVIAAGGAEKAPAIRAALRYFPSASLVTNRAAALAILAED